MRDKIIKESIYLFDEKGFSATSIQNIVDTIGVTKGTFYYYFKSKQELLKDIHVRYIQDLLTQQDAIFEDSNKSYSEKLYSIIYMVISNIKSRRQSARIFFREMRHLSETHISQINQKRNEFRINYQKMIEEGIDKGEFNNNLKADIITFGILGITNWSYYWFNPDGEVSEEELATIYNEMILNGIKK